MSQHHPRVNHNNLFPHTKPKQTFRTRVQDRRASLIRRGRTTTESTRDQGRPARRKRGETVLVEAKLDARDVEALVDTGTNCSLMRTDLWEKLMEDAKNNPSRSL